MSQYYIIAGEASGDLHAAQLVVALRKAAPYAQFRGIGGERMQAAGVELLAHYKDLAYMGFVQVALHLPQILRHMRRCKQDIKAFRPDALILVDYPGFNLQMAQFVTQQKLCPVYYYISPKIWAWKEGRIRQIRKYVSKVFSILPFEVEYFAQKHGYTVQYVGNPSWEEVQAYQKAKREEEENSHKTAQLTKPQEEAKPQKEQQEKTAQQGESQEKASFLLQQATVPQCATKPILALLPGSRRAEIAANLPLMLRAALVSGAQHSHQIVIATAPNIERTRYESLLQKEGVAFYTTAQLHTAPPATSGKQEQNSSATLALFEGESFALLHAAHAALVTSGTATLETALFAVPQVVCYAMRGGAFVNWLQARFLKVPFISLPNLIVGREIVPELVAGKMTVSHLAQQLQALLSDSPERQAQLKGYADLRQALGTQIAAETTAKNIIADLSLTNAH